MELKRQKLQEGGEQSALSCTIERPDKKGLKSVHEVCQLESH